MSLSLKAKINIGIVAYIVVAFSMLGWVYSARHDYREALRYAERNLQKVPASEFYKSFEMEEPPGGASGTIKVRDHIPKPLILEFDDVIAFAVLGAFIGAGWLGLQLLAILFRNTLRKGARALAEGKTEAVQGRSTSPEVTVED